MRLRVGKPRTTHRLSQPAALVLWLGGSAAYGQPAPATVPATGPATASRATDAAVDPPFVEVFRDGNVVAYKRQLPNAVAPIVRVQAQVPDLMPAQLFAVAWDVRSQAAWAPRIKRLDVLSQSATEIVVYEQVDVPVARDRDYVLRLSISPRSDGDLGELRIEARAAADRAVPIEPQHVRMTDLWSTWSFRPRKDGGTVVVYEAYGDPAGALPGWLKRSAALRGPLDFVLALLSEARRRVALPIPPT